MNTNETITYKGYVYELDFQVEDDNRKMLHFVILPNGETKYIDWSPYKDITMEDFQLWVDLGMPDRMHNALRYEGKMFFGSLDRADLLKIKESLNAGVWADK